MTRQIGEHVSVDAEGNEERTRYYLPLKQELLSEVAAAWIKWSLDSLQGEYPTDIDDFRARFSPDDMFRAYLLERGEDIDQISRAERLAFELCGFMALYAALWVHGKIPGHSDAEANEEEPVPN